MNLVLKPKRLGNLYLREICEADYLDYYEIGKDLDTTKYLNWGPFQNPKEALWVIEEIFNHRPEGGLPKGYAITLDGIMIGMIDFHTINSFANSIEIGYILKKEYWGFGYMRRCVVYMVSLAYEMGYSKVVLSSLVDNLRSIHLIESLGFQYEYEDMQEIDTDIYKRCLHYAKYKSEVIE